MEKFAKYTVQTGCLYSGSAHPDRRGPDPSQPFDPRQSQGRLSPPSAPAACCQNPTGQRPVVGGGVAVEQAGRVVDLIGGRREGRGSPKGFSAVEGIDGGDRTLTSWSRGHQRGPSGWGGSTQRRNALGGVEKVREGLERAVHGGSVTMSTAVFRVAQEW
jgi:hypothetical protein